MPTDLNTTQQAWSALRSSPEYLASSSQERQLRKASFDVQYPMGPEIRAAQEPARQDEPAFSSQFFGIVGQSISTAIGHSELIPDIISGKMDIDTAQNIVESIEQQQEHTIPDSVKILHKKIGIAAAKIDKEKSILGKTKAILAAGVDALSDPKAVLLFGAESSSSIFQAAIGTLTGAAVAGPAGAVAGGILGGASAELGPQFEQDVIAEVHKRGLEITVPNVQSVLKDEAFVTEARARTARKSLTTAAVDTALGLGVAKAATTPLRKMAAVALDPVFEAGSEAAGQLAREKTTDLSVLETEELLGEALGSIGMGAVISTPANIKAVGGKLLPEATQDKVADAAVKKLVQADSQPDFTEKVKEAVETGNLAKHSNMDNKDYSPVIVTKAAEAINKKEDTSPAEKGENYKKAAQVYKDLNKKAVEIMEKAEATGDPNIINQADKATDRFVELQQKILPDIKAMGTEDLISPELQQKLVEAKDALSIDEALSDILGSKAFTELPPDKEDRATVQPASKEQPQQKPSVVAGQKDEVVEPKSPKEQKQDLDVLKAKHQAKLDEFKEKDLDALAKWVPAGMEDVIKKIRKSGRHLTATQQQLKSYLVNIATKRDILIDESKPLPEVGRIDVLPEKDIAKAEKDAIIVDLKAKYPDAGSIIAKLKGSKAYNTLSPQEFKRQVEVFVKRKVTAAPSAKAPKPSPALSASELAAQEAGDTITPAEMVAKEKGKDTFNKVKTGFVVGALKSFFQKASNMASGMVAYAAKNKVDADGQKLLDHMLSYKKAFTTTTTDKVFQYKKNEEFQFEDPVSWLAVNGTLPSKVTDAIAAVTYKWLATRGSETIDNDEDAMQGILGLDSETEVSSVAQNLVSDIGTGVATLSESLGKDILKQIGIKAGKITQFQEQERLEISLGLLALANMEKMGLVDRNSVSFASLNKLKNAIKKGDYAFTMTKEEFMVKGQQTAIHFFRVRTNAEGTASDSIERVKKNYNESKGTWDDIFIGEQDRSEFSWNKFIPTTEKDTEKLRKSDQVATAEQTANKVRNENRPVQLAARTMNIFTFLNPDAQNTIVGIKSTDDLQKDLKKGVESTNRSLTRALGQIDNWLHSANKRKAGTASLFYIPAYFGANARMYQEGSIQMQGSKVQRYLFSMKDWEHTFDVNETVMSDMFMLAVSQSLGIDASKGGTLESTIQDTKDALATPVMVKALAAIDKVLTEIGDIDSFDADAAQEAMSLLDPKITEDIVAGVLEGGENVHTFKGLVEYQRYRLAELAGNEFTTDMTVEIDGKANGPIIGFIQLMVSKLTPRQLGIYMSGGLAFTDEIGEEDHATTHDPYQAIGAVWGSNLAQMKEDLAKAKQTKDLQRINAAEALLNPLNTEEGFIAGVTRKLAKNRSVGALYGAGKTAVINGLLHKSFIEDSIKKQLQEFATTTSETAKEDFLAFQKNVNLVAGTTDFTKGAINSNGSRNKKAILQAQVTPEMIKNIHDYLKEFHGDALWAAIEDVYGDIQKAREPLNKAIAISVAYYNAAHDLAIAEHFKTNDELTVGQLQKIRDKIKGIFPRVKTPMGGYIEIAEFDRDREYAIPVSGTKAQSAKIEKANKEINKLRITQYYKDKDLSRLTGRPHQVGKLADPGVKPVVTIIHMIDSMIANGTIGNKTDMGILNVHDGFLMGIQNAVAANEVANTEFMKVMAEYSVAEAVMNSFVTSERAFIKLYPKKNTITSVALNHNFAEMGLTKFTAAKKARNENHGDVLLIKQLTTSNKKTVLAAVTGANQYHLVGQGKKTGNTQQDTIDGIPVEGIIAVAQEEVNARAAIVKTQTKETAVTLKNVEKELLGSRVTPMPSDPVEYTVQKTIDGQNVVDTYDAIKNVSTEYIGGKVAPIVDSPKHDKRLKGLLGSLVQNVMNPIDIFMKTNPEEETHGQLDTSSNKLFISSQMATTVPVSGALTNGIRMSTGEVYVHELVHAVTHTGLKDKHIRRQVKTLYAMAEKVGYTAFLNDPTIDVNDPAHYDDVQAAKERFAYVFRGKSVVIQSYTDPVTKMHYTNELSNHLEEFVALGLTNENFLNALTKISLVKQKQKIRDKGTWAGLKGDNLQETLTNIFGKIMEILYEKFDKGTPKDNVGAELGRLAHLMTKIDSKNKTRVYEASQVMSSGYRKLADQANALIKKSFRAAPVLKKVHGLKVGVKKAYVSDTVLGKALRSMEYKYKTLDYGLTKAIITEMRGSTPRMEVFHNLLHRRKNFLDASKEALIGNTTQVAGRQFKRELTAEEKVTFLKAGMKTDLTYLLDHMDIKEVTTLVKDDKARKAKIAAINKMIESDKTLAPYATYYDQSSNALGHFMVTGRLRKGDNTFSSTLVIAELLNTKQQGKLTKKQAAVADIYINQLATLYALEYTSIHRRNMLAGLMAEDSDGTANILHLHKELKRDALAYNFGGNAYQFGKGYTKEMLSPRIDFKSGTAADEKEFLSQGYSRSELPIERDDNDPTKHIPIYMYTADTRRVNDYLSQTASLTGQRAKGASSERLAQQMGQSSQAGITNNKKIIRDKGYELDAMFTKKRTPTPGGNFMVPQVDDKGMVTKYRYMMSEATKDDYLEKMNEFDVVMGAMAGHILDKARTPVINEELVDALRVLYDEEYDNNPGAYVEVSPFSEDPKLREMYYMLPAKTRAYIKEKWNGQRMFIAKDVLTIAFGYRKYSIVQAFAKTPAERHFMEKAIVGIANFVFQSYGIKVVDNAERVMMTLTKLAKNNIIVKALTVTLSNFGSNIMYLKGRGVPLLDILKYGWEAWNYGLKYQTTKQKLEQTKIELQITEDPVKKQKLTTQLRKYKDQIARNPTTKAMEAGMLPTLVEDIETSTTQSNFPSKTAKYIDNITEKFPKPIVNAGKILLLTHDTGAYKIMNNAVKMTDFVGRYVLYQHYMTEAKIEADYEFKVAHSKAVPRVMEEFINFDLPTHKTIEYFNEIGLIWFSKYALRIQKIIGTGLINKPFDAAASFMTATTFGFDHIGNSLLGVTKDLFSNLGTPLETFMDSIDQILPISIIKSLFND